MAGLEPEIARTEYSFDGPSRDTKRGFLFGSVAGSATGVFLLIAGLLPDGSVHLWDALDAGRYAEFSADLASAALFAIQGLAIGLIAGAPAAFPFMITMSLCERRHPLLQRIWIWGLAGAMFAIPPAVWFMTEYANLDIDGGGRWDWISLYFNMTCGLVGGLAAWRGYYRPVRSNPETLPEQSDRPAS